MDLRVVKTHNAIREAFIDLLSQYDYDSIKIQDILDHALVNRATFYKYYSGKSDLVGQMIANFKAEINQFFFDRLHSETQRLPVVMQQHCQKMFELRKQFLALLKIRNKRHNLYHDMFLMIKQNFIDLKIKFHTDLAIDNDHLDYQATMLATIVMASFKYYFEKDLPLPLVLVDDWQQMLDIVKVQ